MKNLTNSGHKVPNVTFCCFSHYSTFATGDTVVMGILFWVL